MFRNGRATILDRAAQALQEGAGALRDSVADLAATARLKPTDAAPVMQDPDTELCCEAVSKSFGEHVVLSNISFRIKAGEIVAIVGGSGSGKTVLLDILTGLLLPDTGRVLVRNHALPEASLVDLHLQSDDDLDALRLHWAVVFQRNALFTGTVLDNIALWLTEHTSLSEAQIRKRVEESLEAVALDVADVLPKSREALSGGMAKRVAIARAIAVDPTVLFYDEPTTGLDPVISGHIHELIWSEHHRSRSGKPQRTTVIVTHDKELLRRISPRVLMLDSGGLAFDGPYSEFTTSETQAARQYLLAMPVLQQRPLSG